MGEVQLQNLEAGTLGPCYREGSLVIVPDTNHFDLLEPDLVLQHLDELARLVGAGSDETTPLL